MFIIKIYLVLMLLSVFNINNLLLSKVDFIKKTTPMKELRRGGAVEKDRSTTTLPGNKYGWDKHKRPTTVPVKRQTTVPVKRQTTVPVKRQTTVPVKRPTTLPGKKYGWDKHKKPVVPIQKVIVPTTLPGKKYGWDKQQKTTVPVGGTDVDETTGIPPGVDVDPYDDNKTKIILEMPTTRIYQDASGYLIEQRIGYFGGKERMLHLDGFKRKWYFMMNSDHIFLKFDGALKKYYYLNDDNDRVYEDKDPKKIKFDRALKKYYILNAENRRVYLDEEEEQ